MDNSSKKDDDDLEVLAFLEYEEDMEKTSQIMSNYDLYGPLSNPLTHLQDYPSIEAAQKERQKRRKLILERFLGSSEQSAIARGKKSKPRKKVKVKLK